MRKTMRGKIRFVCYPPHLLRTLGALILYRYPQVAAEKAELFALLMEYEKDISLFDALYDDDEALLDQHDLDTGLKELPGYLAIR